MRRVIFSAVLLLFATPAAAQRTSLGIFFGWGAFEQGSPKRCFAVAEPQRRSRTAEQSSFAAVSNWPGRGVRSQFHARLSRAKRPESAVLLKIGDSTFQLVAGSIDAWAPDRRADAEIIAAMRTGLEMVVETRSRTGALVRDRYALRGAATAIDAAAVACSRSRI